ncbi:MAG: hypothetical protein HWD85_12955 [Flavobacteriaceae bacterium]|nr:hypothetical protein [Flavobacteriaceae bacterium]
MKYFKAILPLIFIIFLPRLSNGQGISCQEVYEIVTENYDYKDTVTPIGSSMLTRVTYYTLDGDGFVVANIKRNEYDFRGTPYIFCGISSQRWARFKNEGMFNSWGESFHAYIRDYTCNCY